MYELNRARLVGIGPRGARYSDVTLDLSGLGEQLPAHNLFDTATRRPSPFTLLLLENGGGKSVLLKLLFSVVLPGRRNTVGGASLDKFVLDGDTGHVVLEWMHVTTGERLVTGKVYQRRARSGSDKYPVAEAWYSFRPSSTLDVDTLPVALDGRRRRLDGFHEAVVEADRLEATTELTWLVDDQGGWRAHLRDRGIEPDLFDIQRRMNVDEGEAAKAFKYTSSRDFVDWLLTAVSDPKDASSVAETFAQWAVNLADREQMLLERDFLEGAIAGLDPLAEAHSAHLGAKRDAAAADRAAQLLAVALDARRSAERGNLARLADEKQTGQAKVASRSTERDAARAQYNEIHRQRLQLELAEAETRKVETQGRLDAAELELNGWQTIGALDGLERAISAASQLAAQVAAADEDAAPALARRDETAGRLLAKYLAEATASDAEADQHEADAAAEQTRADEADREHNEAVGSAATGRERHRAARATVDGATERLAAAAAAGLVPPGTTPSQVPGLAEAERSAHASMVVRLKDLKLVVTAANARVKTANGALNEADTALRKATAAADDANRQLSAVEDEAAQIAGLTAVAEAAGERADNRADPASDSGPDDVDNPSSRLTIDELDEAAERLLDQLARDVEDHTDHLDALRADQREDTRVVDALGNGGLLPPRPQVERALEVLDAAGVVAHAGWRYLHEAVPAHERTELIAAHPALADGIVLIDGAQMPAVKRALADARLLPAAAIAIGPGAALLNLTASGTDPVADNADASDGGPVYVMEPTPALFDEQAAEVCRNELTEQMGRRAAQIQEGLAQLSMVTEARTDLHRWRRANPRGHLAELRAAVEATQALRAAAQGQFDAESEERDAAVRDTERAEADLEQTREDERAADDLAAKLEGLADVVEEAADAQRRLPDLVAEIGQHEQEAMHAWNQRRRAEELRSQHARRADQARAQAQRHRAACAEVVSTNGKPAETVPQQSLADLQAEAAAAHEIYQAAEVDPDLRRQADEAAAKVKDLRAELDLRDQAHIAEARRLRGTSAGADRTSWDVGATNARRTVAQLKSEAQKLATQVGQLINAVENASPTEPGRRTWTTLAERWHPTSPQHGLKLEVDAQAELTQAQRRLDEATAAVTDLDRQHRQAEGTERGVHEALLPLSAMLGGVPGDIAAAPYSADVSAAQQAAESAVASLRETRETAERCRGALSTATQELLSYANLARYESLATLARRSILDSPQDSLAARAGEWSASFLARLATLTSDLENVNKHRKTIVDRLSALVHQAVKTLRRAANLSRLPDDLAEWGGRLFLRILFSEPDSTTISVRVGEVVDRVAGEYASRAVGSRPRNARRDGMALLLDAVHASVPKGFTVDVLKPDSVLRDERVSIEEMNDIFSGGQELTAAIVLYCTLAALAANERGQLRSKHSGVLFLDNPIGRANASYLIDLQQSVARALGVQLIYTTGISDDRVLAAFPLWVRLRNDADLRAGLKHIRVADVVRRQLPAPYPDNELVGHDDGTSGGESTPGTVTATRVLRRPASRQDSRESMRKGGRDGGDARSAGDSGDSLLVP